MQNKKEFLIAVLHVFVLTSFALVQTLLEITSRNAEFFVAHNSKPVDIILLLLLLCIMIPGLIVLFEAVAGLFGITTRKTAHYIIVAGLFAITALVILKKQFTGTTGTYLLASSAVTGMILTILYSRIRHVRNFLTVLSPLILLFPALFLFNSPVFKIVFPEKSPTSVAVKADHAVPIIMIIFDEFNLTTLMNEDHEIDHIRYPNFSALSKDSTWFRNATTVSESTDKAVPAILTGLYPETSKIPIASDHPGNLFTLLGRSYNLKVTESISQLCPANLCKEDPEPPRRRMVALMSDLSLVYLHILLPPDLSATLPAVTQNWKNFTSGTVKESDVTKKEVWDWGEHAKDTLIEKDRFGQFVGFINSIVDTGKPTLFFLHTMLPHAPYQYLPSGKTYNATGFSGLAAREKWGSDEQAIIQDYQRYILQVGFMDSLLGKLLSHLKEIDLYDRSLIVITADHGVSFRPDDFRRPLTETNFQDIMPVPLFIKSPNQLNGVISDRSIETVDILPTIAEILGVKIPWSLHGHSALDLSQPERSEQVIFFNNARERLVKDYAALDAKYSTLERMHDLFGTGVTPDGLYKADPYATLIGNRIDQTDVTGESSHTVELDMTGFYENMDPESSYVPVQIKGSLPDLIGEEGPLKLAIAVNGTIHAVTRTFSNTRNMAKFTAIVPETAFRRGRNEVEIFIISGSEREPRLAYTKRHDTVTYSLSVSGRKEEVIISSDGKSVPIVPNAINGALDIINVKNNLLNIAGWAADIKQSEVPKSILVFVKGEFFYRGGTGMYRPDIVNGFGKDAPAWSGYNFALPFLQSNDISIQNIRVFAVTKKGIASELIRPTPPVTYSLIKNDSGDEVIIPSEGESIPVIQNALYGQLERISIDSDGVLLSGWAADIKNSETPENILIFANGILFHAAPCNTDRNDVVKAYNNNQLKRSGFAYRFNINITEADVSAARLFAVSRRGAASELFFPEDYRWGRKTL